MKKVKTTFDKLRIGDRFVVPSFPPKSDSELKEKLFDADPECSHEIVSSWSGIKCKKCGGWFCY